MADAKTQREVMGRSTRRLSDLPRFGAKLDESGLAPLTAGAIEILQINAGKMCNQACGHCHVDAGPDRREIMTRETFEACLRVLESTKIPLVDLTGGAPEMNPNFRWFVEQISALGRQVMVRCNLTIIVSNEKYRDLPEFFKAHRVHVVSSLPYFDKGKTDRQRGDHVFEKSIQALKMLNEVGYGRAGSGLKLDLVYNPAGAFLPGSQSSLQADFKRELAARFGIEFNSLFAITNMPISRFLEFLQRSQNLEAYMEKLVASFNPAAVRGLMCKNTLSVGWDGGLFDCDFNQMLEMPVATAGSKTIYEFNESRLLGRAIAIDQHCYGCTAGAGSSCGGATA